MTPHTPYSSGVVLYDFSYPQGLKKMNGHFANVKEIKQRLSESAF